MVDEIVKITLRLSPHIKGKAQKEADLAYKYQWIKKPTIGHLFIWMVDEYLPVLLREAIKKRRASIESNE